jgi:acyl carrier protein
LANAEAILVPELLTDVIRRVIAQNARLVISTEEIADDDDLHRMGMSSHALVAVMLGLEDELAVQFPDDVLSKETFSSIASIRDTITRLADRPS